MKTIKAVDLFCGAGGTSTGLARAVKKLGCGLDLLAVNHWDIAILTHSANHPYAEHRCESLDNVDPRKVIPGGYLDLLVASPECTHHSRARGGKPISDQSRASAWHVLRWAEALYIENILIENVPEFMSWGPLDKNGDRVQSLKGKTFLSFLEALRSLGYNVDYRVLNAADYGDPTTRKRLFILARREKTVVWPEPTHAKTGSKDMFGGSRQPWKAAREIIDWSLPGESIFSRKKPLAANTMRRIAKGLRKFCANPFLVEYHSATSEGGDRVQSVDSPLPTVDTSNRFALAEPFIFAMNHGKDDNRSYSLGDPMPTVTSVDAWGLAQPYLVKYNGTGTAMSVEEPLDTVTAKDRFGLVIPLSDGGEMIVDIKFRMLQPHELAAAMSFPPGYQFAGSRDQKVRQIGNAVPGEMSQALCLALIS